MQTVILFILHAAADTLLGAGLGDIGRLFPDTDQAFNGADSHELLRQAWKRIRTRGYHLGNLWILSLLPKQRRWLHTSSRRVFSWQQICNDI